MTRNAWFQWPVIILLAGILGVNMILLKQDKILRERLDNFNGAREVHPGEAYPDFGGLTLDRQWKDVRFAASSRKSLLFLISTGCPACESNRERFEAISKKLDEHQWNVVWLSRDPWEKTRKYWEENRMQGTVLTEFSAANYRKLTLRLVPKVIVVNRAGTVEKVWTGRLGKERWSDLLSYLSSQPGVSDVAELQARW